MIVKKKSGFPSVENEVIRRISFGKLTPGIFCVHNGHQGSTYNVKMENGFCHICAKTGPTMKSTNDMSTMTLLKSIMTTSSPFFIVLASRSLSGVNIPPSIF